MKFNLKKATKIAYDPIDKDLAEQRDELDHHNVDGEGNYDRVLDKNRKNEETVSITEKQFDHKEEKTATTIESRMDDKRSVLPGDWRDDRTHNTNTLPINELAEERQRKRMALRGDGDGFEPMHFQEYKKVDLDLTHENFANLAEINDEIDKVYTASAEKRMTTSEKIMVKALKEKRNKIIDGLKNENRNS